MYKMLKSICGDTESGIAYCFAFMLTGGLFILLGVMLEPELANLIYLFYFIGIPVFSIAPVILIVTFLESSQPERRKCCRVDRSTQTELSRQ